MLLIMYCFAELFSVITHYGLRLHVTVYSVQCEFNVLYPCTGDEGNAVGCNSTLSERR